MPWAYRKSPASPNRHLRRWLVVHLAASRPLQKSLSSCHDLSQFHLLIQALIGLTLFVIIIDAILPRSSRGLRRSTQRGRTPGPGPWVFPSERKGGPLRSRNLSGPLLAE